MATRDTVQFVPNGSDEFNLIERIADRAVLVERKFNGTARHGAKLHHQMNVSAVHASGNPLRLEALLEADDFNFAHDVFGIDRHLDRDTGKLTDFFSPRFSARVCNADGYHETPEAAALVARLNA